MSVFSSFRISASGLSAQRLRMDVIAGNIANANTTRTEDGGPYRRREVVFQAVSGDAGHGAFAGSRGTSSPGRGVAVAAISEDPSPPRLVYDPGHPDADSRGYVAMPNVDMVREMVDMIAATRVYEACAAAFDAAKTMAMRALDIGRV